MHDSPKPKDIKDFIKWRDQAAITAFFTVGLAALFGGVALIIALCITSLLAEDPPPPPEPVVAACSDDRLEALSSAVTACASSNISYVERCMHQARIAICAAPPDTDVLERVAEIEHVQWTEWSKAVADEVGPERRERWSKYWVPYDQLPEDIKELDREWARKVLAAIQSGDASADELENLRQQVRTLQDYARDLEVGRYRSRKYAGAGPIDQRDRPQGHLPQ